MQMIPENKLFVIRPKKAAPGAVIYGYMNNDRICGRAYQSARASKPEESYWFQDMARLEAWAAKKVDQWAARIDRKEQDKAARKEAKAEFLAQIVPGTVLVASWGYDQTNVDFYVVKAVKGSKVTLAEMSSCEDGRENAGNAMACYVKPGSEIPGTEFQKMVNGPMVRIDSSRRAYLWEGRPMYCSWYA